MPGARGAQRRSPTMIPNVSRPTANVQKFVCPNCVTIARTSWTKLSASTEKPKQFGQLTHDDRDRQARKIAHAHGFGDQICDESESRAAATTQIAPTSSASVPASDDCASTLPAASGRIAAAIIGPNDESGPSTRRGEGPKIA